MATLYRSAEGIFTPTKNPDMNKGYYDSSGYFHINEPANPAPIQSRQVPQMGSGSQAPVQAGSQDQSGSPQGLPQNFNADSPLTKFNVALMDMLKRAQSGTNNEELYKQQRALQRSSIARSSDTTPEELRSLSPSQQEAIRSGNTKALEPELDAIAAKIKSQNDNLRTFEDTIDKARSFGETFSKSIKVTPTPEVIEGYRQMIRAGAQPSSVPDEVRNTVLSKLTGDDWKTWSDANRKGQQDALTMAQSMARDDRLTNQENTRVDRIVNQFDNESVVKQFNTINEATNFLKSLGSTSADDIARVYQFAKIMDPNSAVREGEYDTVQKYSQALLQAYGLKTERVFTNSGFLTDEARTFLQNTINKRHQSSLENYTNVANEYSRRVDNITGKSGTGGKYITNYSGAFQKGQAPAQSQNSKDPIGIR